MRVYHREVFVRTRWAPLFTVRLFLREGALGSREQDPYVLDRRLNEVVYQYAWTANTLDIISNDARKERGQLLSASPESSRHRRTVP